MSLKNYHFEDLFPLISNFFENQFLEFLGRSRIVKLHKSKDDMERCSRQTFRQLNSAHRVP